MEAALPIILKWLAAGLPEMITALQGAQQGATVQLPTAGQPMPLPFPAAPLNPLGWPSPLPPEVGDATIAGTPASTGKSGNPGIRLLQVALVAAGQQVGVDGVSGPETEKALAAVIQHIMSRVG